MIPCTGKTYQSAFTKVAFWKCSTKGAMHGSPFVERLVLNLLSVKLYKNAMRRNFVPSTAKIYHWHFAKIAVLKRSTKGAMNGSFRRTLYT